MTVEEGRSFFQAVPSIRDKLETLGRVGLDYVEIGQAATTLSGGEAQRVKLAKELSRRATGQTLYILDEPTTGLHFADIAKLLEVLQALVDQGNTILVIEHNLEVIKTADWIIDLGPEGGDKGGDDRRHRHAGGRRQDARQLYGPISGAAPQPDPLREDGLMATALTERSTSPIADMTNTAMPLDPVHARVSLDYNEYNRHGWLNRPRHGSCVPRSGAAKLRVRVVDDGSRTSLPLARARAKSAI